MSEFNPSDVRPGDFVVVRDTRTGEEATMLALSGVYSGRDVPCIQICHLDAYPNDEGIPWPADAILGRVSGPA